MSKIKKIKSHGPSPVYKKLMQEATALDHNSEFSAIQKGNPITDLLLMFRFQNGHIHRVYPDSEMAQDMLHTAIETDFGTTLPTPLLESNKTAVPVDYKEEQVKLPKRIIFHNRQAIGDILMFTCAVRDFKRAFPNVQVQVRSTAGHIWDHNPNVNRDAWSEIIDPMLVWKESTKPSAQQMIDLQRQCMDIAIQRDVPVLIYIGPGKGTNASNRSDLHFANAYRLSMETVLGISIPQGPIRPDIYMTEEEYNAPPIVEPPYWLITAGEKGDWTCKTFPFKKWEEVVESLPEIKFVQLGGKGHRHPELKGPNVINMIGQTEDRNTGVRDLFNLFNYCEGSMGLVSFQMHLAAAFNKPCVVIAGAREPVWFTRYPGQNYMASDGCLPCTINDNGSPKACWFCDLKRCIFKSEYKGQEIPLCADLFTYEDVRNEISRYYKGGRLNLDKPVGRSKLVNVIKSVKPSFINPKEDKPVETCSREVPEEKPERQADDMWGFQFGGGSLTDRDWEFMKSIIKENKIKTVLEFGAGLSTLLLNDFGLDVLTFEDKPGWIKKIQGINPECDIRLWDGVTAPELESIGEGVKCDLAFVDGPSGGQSREFSIRYASKIAKLIIVHDAGRVPEKEWQAKYLEEDFYLASKGGHRCHFWREGKLEPIVFKEDDKIVKFVFNGRGDGGAERTCTWLMKEFIDKRYKVQYISPNPQPCGTFRSNPVKGVLFTDDLEEIKKPCELLFLYANDWIWEFPKLESVFTDLKAKKKVMGINYKMGGIGNAQWTFNWDKYIFLNSMMKNELENRMRGTYPLTKVIAPPTDLTVYFDNKPDYNSNLKLIRHSSQGDAKYPKNFNEMIDLIFLEIPDAEIFLMPAPSFLSRKHMEDSRVHVFQRNQPPVKDFLKLGNVFWYALPTGGYTEGGPKVIMEAQASGLPIITDNHSGAIDRVANGSGFLCDDFSQHISAMKAANDPKIREELGKNARNHADMTYGPHAWVEEIIKTVPNKNKVNLVNRPLPIRQASWIK